MNTLDKIAVMVTATICIILLVIIVSPVFTGRVLSNEKAQMVSGLISSSIAIIGMYVGAKLKSGVDK